MQHKPRVLTEAFIKALKPAPQGTRYMVADAIVPSLKVRVTDRNHKSFVLWRRVDPRAQSASALSLGTVGELTLADARTKARSWLATLAAGTDPRAAERETRANTVAAAVELFLQRHVKGQRRAQAVEREIRNEMLGRWGHMPLRVVRRQHVIELINQIVDRGARAQARNVLTNCKVFFSWCVEQGLLDSSPAAEVRPKRLIGPKRHRTRVLDDDEFRLLWSATGELAYPYGDVIRVLALTGARLNEVAQARWGEFDLASKVWIVPAERYKSGSNHIVPLSDAVIELLEQLPRWSDGDFLFSNNGGRSAVANFALAKQKLDAAMGAAVEPFVLHDLRRSVRTRLSELRIEERIAELVLGHAKRGLARVYDQHRFVQEMREALEAWAARLQHILAPLPANVVRLGRKHS